jgi:hypothetical protein
VTSGGATPPDDVDVLEIGPRRPVHPRGKTRAVAMLIAAAAVVAGVTVPLLRHAHHAPQPAAAAARTGSSRSTAPGRPALPRRAVPPVAVTRLPPRLLGARGRWSVVAVGDRVVERFELGRGRVTRTAIPALQSSGAVSVLAARHEVIVRPWDFVPGYSVPDLRRARLLPGLLATNGPVLPGPDPDHVWLATSSTDRLRLVAMNGRPTRTSVAVPRGDTALDAMPDQAGQLLFGRGYGMVDVGASGTRQVTSGRLLAAGRSRWLIVRCRSGSPCRAIVVGRASGTRRTVPIGIAAAHAVFGIIAPDGRTAALILRGGRVALFDCRTGRARRLPVRARISAWPPWQLLAWSPDSRLVFVVTARGGLAAARPRTGSVADVAGEIGLPLPSINAVAVRAAP